MVFLLAFKVDFDKVLSCIDFLKGLDIILILNGNRIIGFILERQTSIFHSGEFSSNKLFYVVKAESSSIDLGSLSVGNDCFHFNIYNWWFL